MGLTNEQEKAREEDANVRYLSQNICNKDGDKDFVFISYKSDDWEIVQIVQKIALSHPEIAFRMIPTPGKINASALRIASGSEVSSPANPR